jgi:hypothetical protein
VPKPAKTGVPLISKRRAKQQIWQKNDRVLLQCHPFSEKMYAISAVRLSLLKYELMCQPLAKSWHA